MQQNNTPKRMFPNHSNKSIGNKQLNDKISRLNTDKLDDAMQELIDICQLYNDKISIYDKAKDELNDNKNSNKEISNNLISNKFSQNRKAQKTVIKSDNNFEINCKQAENDNNINKTDFDGIIDKLQKKQTDLQAQLEEVLKISKRLELKQKHKLNCIFEDEDDDSNSRIEDEETDEEDELIEFQKIENDLRISDLNRQLDDIQEELRIRLYKRLLSNTNSNYNSNKKQQEQQTVRQTTVRRGSQTDESSPTSSSCSDEQPTTSLPSIISDGNDNNLQRKACLDTVDGIIRRSRANNNQLNSPSPINNDNDYVVHEIDKNSFEENMNITREQISTNSSSGYLSIRSNESLIDKSSNSVKSESNNIYSDIIDTNLPLKSNNKNQNQALQPTTIFHQNKNTSSINSDLERIDEDEEDGQDYYSDSNHFRTIYEEKLSPIIYNNSYLNNSDYNYKIPKSYYKQAQCSSQTSWQYSECINDNIYNEPTTSLQKLELDSSVDDQNNLKLKQTLLKEEFINKSTIKNNRPLTMYLPKPNEEIDLIEHIQALGHDLSIISNDLKLNSTTAQGYLWKSCSNNSKRWLKRYFYFDRKLKILTYYDNNGQLVNKKKQTSPNNSIKFDEISDVYVDHKLSVLAEKNQRSSSKKRNYVFVLVTTGRKYLLSSRRAEIMRAWIDILFTAAKANDYFLNQLTNNDNDNCNEENLNQFKNQGDINSAALENS